MYTSFGLHNTSVSAFVCVGVCTCAGLETGTIFVPFPSMTLVIKPIYITGWNAMRLSVFLFLDEQQFSIHLYAKLG